MSTNLETALTATLGKAAREAGLAILSAEAGTDFNNHPTAKFKLALSPDAPPAKTLQLELSDAFDFHKPELLPEMTSHLREAAKRLRNPRPDAYVTVAGLPVSLNQFAWPFHGSTSGADTYIVHGVAHLEDGTNSPLHVKIAASMTVTFAEIVPAAEQPYAETFIYNAIRKTFDQGQLELLKSGNRQPVPVTTRYYSRWQKKFIFTDTDDASRLEFLELKAYWLSHVMGNDQPVWIADPRDAQYLNTTAEELKLIAVDLSKRGLLTLTDDYASPTSALLARAEEYNAKMHAALDITKPTFNEEMRAGHTNM
ncbi:hypothetical protein H7849_19375 [Alloacidobacterium dinghuense]|uniref:Uncharacterized protein n=1 Tax=Alloacidobacterium dinghuense TaxID=2763107 RepID=A0A7G8BFB4_9BACT|nr:hypothetical protein [Alloacidobacterium dinghuense]QNI31234.1 hypothetical protein H7849_19375 [Alloacidobacterium dinghuense]